MSDYFKKIKDMNRNMPKSTKIIYGIILAVIAVGLLKKIVDRPEILLMIPALYIGIVFHEVAHGYAAYLMGDPTAKIWGRLTLNPSKHIDIFGVLTPIILVMLNSPFLIGWAKPVPVNYAMLKRKKTGLFIVAIAGVFVNLINVILAVLIWRYLYKNGIIPGTNSVTLDLMKWQNLTAITLFCIIQVNLGLAIFNLIPIPPLDGSKIVESLAGEKIRNFIESMEQFGFIVIIVMACFGLFDKTIGPIYSMTMDFVLKLVSG